MWHVCVTCRELTGCHCAVKRVPSIFDHLDLKDADDGKSRLQALAKKASNNLRVIVFLSLVTLWVLVSDDIKMTLMPKAADLPMAIFTCIYFVIFMAEMLMYALADPHYLFSYFFCLDCIALMSLLLDIPAIEDALYSAAGNNTSLSSATLARATRTSIRIGTKAGRIASVRLFCSGVASVSCCCNTHTMKWPPLCVPGACTACACRTASFV